MSLHNMSSARSLVICLLLILSSFASAQNNNFPTLTSGSDAASSSQTASSSDSASRLGSSSATSTDASSTSSATDSSTSGSSTSDPPSLTSSTSSSNPNLPTLANVLPPPLIVPDTADAPYMQHSNLPEGTVFIGVGAGLAFLGSAVLAWRGMVAWSLHRSVKRAANAAYASDTKSLFPFSDTKGRYSTLHHSANMSLEQLSNMDTSYGGAGQAYKRSSHKPKHDAHRAPTSSSLFFSPTGAGMSAPHSRAPSGHLPSGYYAQGSSALNNGDGLAYVGGPRAHSPYSRDSYADAGTPSPPDSPGLRPNSRPGSMPLRPGSGHQHLSSTASGQGQRRSKLGLGETSVASPPQGRAPSAYLEGLMDSHGFGPRERF